MFCHHISLGSLFKSLQPTNKMKLLCALALSVPLTVMSQERISIYQVLPRLYGNLKTTNKHNGTIEENGCGKLNDFDARRLKRIKDMGFTHIWYTGLIEHATKTDYSAFGIKKDNPEVVKGNAGSPYAIKDYYDIDPDLCVDVQNRMKEFEELIARTHKAGLKMIMDFIPNHVARQYHSDVHPAGIKDLGETDNSTLAFSPQNNVYYIPNEHLHLDSILKHQGTYTEIPARVSGNDVFSAWPGVNDWYETIKLNYGVDYQNGHSNHFSPITNTWKKMTDILLYWAKKGIDGFRCDMAEMVPVEFWHYAIAHVKQKYPELKFIAEVYNPNEYRNYIHIGGFDYLYDKVGLYDTLRSVVRQENSATTITHCWQSTDDIQDHMLHFLENHDEQRIASPFFAGNAEKALPALVISATLDKAPLMIYAGQEIGEKGLGNEGFSGNDGRTTIFDYWGVPSYQKLSRGVKYLTRPEKILYSFYKAVVKAINSSEAIREGKKFDLMYVNGSSEHFDPNRTFALLRSTGKQTALIVANFADIDKELDINIPTEAFTYLDIKPLTTKAKDIISNKSQIITLSMTEPTKVSVSAHSAIILVF